MIRILSIGIGVAILVALAACAGQNRGQVYVSQPEVFTRERLVDDRLQEYTWLEQQLGLADTAAGSFQGLSDERLLQGLTDSLSLSYGLNSSASSSTGSATGTSSGGGGSGTSGGGTSSGSGGSSTGQGNGGQGSSMPTSLPSGNPNKTQAQESLIDQFNDKEAYRDAVNARVRDVELDDTHDLRGRTMYTLKYNVSLVPAGREHRKAILFLKVCPPPTTPQWTAAAIIKTNGALGTYLSDLTNGQTNKAIYNSYRQWVSSLNIDLENETRAMMVRLLADDLPAGYLDSVIQVLQNLQGYPLRIETVLNPTLTSTNRASTGATPPHDFLGTLQFVAPVQGQTNATQKTPDIANKPGTYLNDFLTTTCVKLADYKLSNAERRHSILFGKDKDDVEQTNYLKFAVAAAIWEKYYDTWGDGGPYLISLNPINAVLTSDGEAYFTNSLKIPSTPNAIIWATAQSTTQSKGTTKTPTASNNVTKHSTQPEADSPNQTLSVEDIAASTPNAIIWATVQSTTQSKDTIKTPAASNSVTKPPTPPQDNSPNQTLSDQDKAASRFGYYAQTCQEIEAEQSLNQPRILAVTPTEYAQNISDVAAREDFLNLALSLGAMFHGVNINNSANYLQQSEVLLNAIQREPLEVGFPIAPDQCGVLIGPPFQIDHDSNGAPTADVSSFTQVPARYSFTADIAVPGWWSSITVESRFIWVDHDHLDQLSPTSFTETPAKTQSQASLTGAIAEAQSQADAASHGSMTVNLITDPEATTTAIGFYNDRQKRSPQIQMDAAGMAEQATLQATTRAAGIDATASASTQPSAQPLDQTILVRGTDLWRNPKVFVGPRQADTVEVLPDMNGLLAHFNSFPYPATQPSDTNPISQDVTVVTTFGADTLHDFVTVYPPPGASKPAQTQTNAAFASVNEPFVVDADAPTNTSDYLVFNLDKTSTPPLGSTQLQIWVRPHNSAYNQWRQLDGSAVAPMKYPLQYDTGSVTAKLVTADVFNNQVISGGGLDPSKQPVNLDIDLRIPTIPTNEPQSVLVKSPVEVVFFAKEDARKLNLVDRSDGKSSYSSTNGTLDAPIAITIPLANDPRLAAYPTLMASLQPNSAPVTVLLSGSSNYSATGVLNNGTIQVTHRFHKTFRQEHIHIP
jgi:hypothetical protein